MDAWSADQLKKMQAGGNGVLNDFFRQYGVGKNTDIRDKYNSRVAEIYREKIKAAVEGRPFNPPPPSAVQVSVASTGTSSARPGPRPGSAGNTGGSRQAAGSHDEWGDWGDKPAASNGAAAGGNGFNSNSEYSKAQYMASAANKEEFFARKMHENQTKPDHLPPSQGGKYVGFGSTPAPRPPSGMQGGAGGVDDVTALLSKGLASLGQVAGVAATTATTVVQSGTQNINQMLQEKQVGQTLQQTSKVVAEKAQVGWMGLKSLYANVASTVESAAKDSGYNISLGSKAVATSLQQQQFEQQLQQQRYGGYGGGGFGSDSYAAGGSSSGQGAGGSGVGNGMHKSASEGRAAAGVTGGSEGAAGRGGAGNGFAGFNDGADNGWDKWGAKSATSQPQRAVQHSASSPALQKQATEDDWGKW
eukprot:GHRQ01004954.1.p1 GENE.GHRQ01004954.1~~GHRQ01004954.1.p1  ORF type:complete len:417 (+),score=199.33 GHRQ01004954.1:225-1475(+)